MVGRVRRSVMTCIGDREIFVKVREAVQMGVAYGRWVKETEYLRKLTLVWNR